MSMLFWNLFVGYWNGGVGLRYNHATPIEMREEIGAGDEAMRLSRMEYRQENETTI